MKGLVHSIRMAIALLGLAVAFACPHAVRAQDVVRGSFVLPFEVQWQGKTLAPGEYHFRLPPAHPARSCMFVTRRIVER